MSYLSESKLNLTILRPRKRVISYSFDSDNDWLVVRNLVTGRHSCTADMPIELRRAETFELTLIELPSKIAKKQRNPTLREAIDLSRELMGWSVNVTARDRAEFEGRIINRSSVASHNRSMNKFAGGAYRHADR